MSRNPKDKNLQHESKDAGTPVQGYRQTAEKLSKVFYSNPVMMAVSEWETGRLVEVNDSFCSALGYKREELIGKTTLELNLWVFPEKREDLVRMTESRALPKQMEVEIRKKNGEILVGLIFTETLFLNGEKNILSTIIDITKQKEVERSLHESENRYQRLVESMPAAMIVHAEDKIVFINNEGVKMFRGSSPADFIGKPILDLIHPDYRELGYQRIKDIYSKKKDAEFLAEKFVRLDGEVIDVEVAGKIVDYRGKPSSQVVIKDITERKLIEAERLKALKLESLGILAGGIAHDFNNILTGIMGSISLSLLKLEEGSKMHTLLRAGEKACLRARELTRQLLTFSRGGEPVKENASIAELIRESANFALRGSNVTCIYSFAENLLPVEVDKGQIGQVIQNLILNADQAMPKGGTIEVSARNVSLKNREVSLLKQGKYIKITLKDEGIGIDEQFHQKIFDPYFSTKSKGSGLGLSVVYSIINKHNGAVTVDSQPGKGTLFTIYLPASGKKGKQRETIKPEKTVKKSVEGFVLLMDDDPQVREIGSLMVESIGIEVQCATDGKEALELCKKAKQAGRPFDVVIMDLTVPGGMGGKTAVKKLLALEPDAKVVVASGYSNDPIMANYKKYGFVDVLPKPLVLEDLASILTRLIKSQ
jgi:two-component system cell cycle sensor histidine kinase/response regulator CckA